MDRMSEVILRGVEQMNKEWSNLGLEITINDQAIPLIDMPKHLKDRDEIGIRFEDKVCRQALLTFTKMRT